MECVDPDTKAPDSALVARIQKEALQRGLLLLSCGTYGNVIRFLYPLTIPQAQFDAALGVLAQAMVE
ncbi:4-aminobutyrate aminotransferase PuuE [compost metagenome]